MNLLRRLLKALGRPYRYRCNACRYTGNACSWTDSSDPTEPTEVADLYSYGTTRDNIRGWKERAAKFN
jgi:hypothetical protein